MKKRLVIILTVLLLVGSGIFLLSCSNREEFTASYTASNGGYVSYLNENGRQSKLPAFFIVKSGEDITEVTANPYKGFAFEKWSDGVTTATRRDTSVTDSISVQAIFKRVEFFLEYKAVSFEGFIVGNASQSVAPGSDAEEVTAMPYTGYRFVRWSDGVTTATRHDTSVTEDISVSAIFKKEEYAVTYIAGEHGSIQGEAEQSVKHQSDGTTVTAVPNKGYVFVGWSDGETSATRKETIVTEDMCFSAEFSPITREYELNYRKTFESEINKEILTLTYDELDGVKLPVPEKEHFIFCGWYYGETQVADENGNLIIDDDFLIPEVVQDEIGRKQDIRAKWVAEETFTFKILIVYVTRIQATLCDRYGVYHDVDFTMSELQRRFCEESTKLLKLTMDEMCDGLVDFQIDEYYTTQTITNAQLRQVSIATDSITTRLDPSAIPEIKDIRNQYGSVISVFGFGGDKPNGETAHLFQYAGGTAGDGSEGSVYLDSLIYAAIVDGYELTDILNGARKQFWIKSLGAFIHEIAHTIEIKMVTYSYHRAVVSNSNKYARVLQDPLATLNRLYYTQSIECDGELVGIPYGFWKGDVAKVIYNVTKSERGVMGGVSRNEYVDSAKSNYSVQFVVYGSDAFGVVAHPFPGYRFVGWSDGVTTPERKDRNITSDFTVTAIFEQIVYTINVVASDGGSVMMYSGGDVQKSITITLKESEITPGLEAVALPGYRFVGWSDGKKDAYWYITLRSSNLNKFDDNYTYTLTAIFEKIE